MAWALGLVLAAACAGAARAQQLQPGSYPAVDPALYAPPQVVGAPTGAIPLPAAPLQPRPPFAQAGGAHTRCPCHTPCTLEPCVALALARALLALQFYAMAAGSCAPTVRVHPSRVCKPAACRLSTCALWCRPG